MKEITVKINKTKSWFFEKINKTDKPLVRLIKNKTEKNQISKVRNEKGEVTVDNAEIQGIIRGYYEQLYGNKMDNLEEMDRFLEKFNLPRPNQQEIEIMNPIASTEIEAVIKNLTKKQKPRTRWLHRRILSNIQRRANAYSSKTLSKSCRGRNTSKLTLQGHHHPDPKTRQRQHEKRKLQADITDEQRCKNPQQNFSKQFSNTPKSSYTMIKLGLFQGGKHSSIYANQ